MKMVILILQDVEKMVPIIEKLECRGVHGATMIDCRGAAAALDNYAGGSFLGSLRAILEPAREENEMMFTVVNDDMVDTVFDTIKEFVDLGKPYSGVAFTVPVDRAEGFAGK